MDSILKTNADIFEQKQHAKEQSKVLRIFLLVNAVIIFLLYLRAFFWNNSALINALASLGLNISFLNMGQDYTQNYLISVQAPNIIHPAI